MNDAPKSQDVNQASALRGEPEAADDDQALAPPRVTGSPKEIWLNYGDIEDDCTHDECYRDGDVTWCQDKVFDSDVRYVLADQPPQAASGSNQGARSDDPITKFGIKPHSTLAQLKDDEDLRLYVQAHIEEARSAEQGATPPAPAAQIRALISKWRHAADHLGLEGLASLADCADELESALAASPQPAAPAATSEWLRSAST